MAIPSLRTWLVLCLGRAQSQRSPRCLCTHTGDGRIGDTQANFPSTKTHKYIHVYIQVLTENTRENSKLPCFLLYCVIAGGAEFFWKTKTWYFFIYLEERPLGELQIIVMLFWDRRLCHCREAVEGWWWSSVRSPGPVFLLSHPQYIQDTTGPQIAEGASDTVTAFLPAGKGTDGEGRTLCPWGHFKNIEVTHGISPHLLWARTQPQCPISLQKKLGSVVFITSTQVFNSLSSTLPSKRSGICILG